MKSSSKSKGVTYFFNNVLIAFNISKSIIYKLVSLFSFNLFVL